MGCRAKHVDLPGHRRPWKTWFSVSISEVRSATFDSSAAFAGYAWGRFQVVPRNMVIRGARAHRARPRPCTMCKHLGHQHCKAATTRLSGPSVRLSTAILDVAGKRSQAFALLAAHKSTSARRDQHCQQRGLERDYTSQPSRTALHASLDALCSDHGAYQCVQD